MTTHADPPPDGAADWTVPQAWDSYTTSEHAVWDTLFARQSQMLPGRVTSAFLRGLDVLREVVATAGTALTEPNLKALSRFTGDIRLSFDADKAGVNATERAIPIASRVGVSLSIIDIPSGKDPDELIKQDPKILAADIGVALDINNPIATALPFQAVVLPPSEKTGNKVQVNFGVDPHAISFELKPDGLQHAAIDCGVGVYTDKGISVRAQE